MSVEFTSSAVNTYKNFYYARFTPYQDIEKCYSFFRVHLVLQDRRFLCYLFQTFFLVCSSPLCLGTLISYTCVYKQSKQSKHSCIFWYYLSVAFVIYCCLILTTCFNPFIGPSSGLQLYKLCWSLLLAVTHSSRQ